MIHLGHHKIKIKYMEEANTQQQKIEKLQREIDDIKHWMNQRKAQQLVYPLDNISKDIIEKDFLRYQSNLDYTNSSGQIFPNILVSHDKKQELFSVYPPLYSFTVNTTTDILTFDTLLYANDDQVNLLTTDTLPTPLSDVVTYYIINVSGNTCQLSLTSGGAAVNITSTGTGTHYLYLFA